MNINLNDKSLVKTQAYIAGEWVDADSGDQLDVLNPATGAVIARVASVGVAETRRAIDAAAKAMKDWQASPATERATILRRWYDLVIDNLEDLAKIMTAEQGKTLAESRTEVMYGASFIEWFAEESKRVYGDTIPTARNDQRAIVIKQPIGLAAAITPWNFPNAMVTRKAAPALAAGCAIVIKPAAETPLSALALAVLAERAGVPAGLLNIAVGADAASIGQELTSNPKIRKLSFTGSTAVGKLLMRQCASTVKRTSMELGGNAPVIVFEDADIDLAVAGVAASKFRNSGQTCICANRIIVHERIYATFVEKLSAVVQNFQFGDGMDAATTHGPLITPTAVNNVDSLVNDALASGATAVLGGAPSKPGSCYYPPTILTNVSPDMRVFSEEIFGPVAPIFKFENEEDAVALANDTEFGLAAYLFTKDISRTWRVSEALEYGMVGINETAISSAAMPFGGIKESGQGREGSKYGLEDYLETKYLCIGAIDR